MRAFIVALSLVLTAAAGHAQDGTLEEPHVRVVTNRGDIVFRLDPIRAPLTVERFLALVDAGFYEGMIFHRVIQGFLAQAGAYTADFESQTTESGLFNESGNGLTNMRGTVGFARSNEPHSGTTQFFINLADNSDLNPRPTRWGYAVFGEVVEGMNVVDEIGHSQTGAGGPFESDVPVDLIVIERIERIEPIEE